ncbi:hypothetical protein [Streptomyces incarnatus]|uniref:hypothetical protein n=1 Tax=Streptomyces incarnatus TaxID=665007 RepID=UPI000AA242E1|nr:hypothetical protein [Streptomyces incarnatus]
MVRSFDLRAAPQPVLGAFTDGSSTVTGSAAGVPWFLACCAQFAVPAAAGGELVRALTVRAHPLHPATTTASGTGRVSMIFVNVMTAEIVLFLLWFARCRRNAELLSPGRLPGSVTRCPWPPRTWAAAPR